MRIVRATIIKRSSWLFFPIGLLILVRYEVFALLGPWTFVARSTTTTTTTTSHQGSFGRQNFPLISLRQRSSDDNENNEDDRIISELDETRNIVRDQQEKIDMLMKLLVSNDSDTVSSSSSSNTDPAKNIIGSDYSSTQSTQPSQSLQQLPVQSSAPSYAGGAQPVLPPLKAMLFIDGTWLYYSLHGREQLCPIQRRFGKGWQYKYNVVWENLPRIVCQALQEQDESKGWSSQTMGTNGQNIPRPIEVTRVSVFTSYKADTPKTSIRYQMFQEMLNAKFDVHMMETVGRGEKCVDIQLAVDMLHFATVPDAYDVAILLTGDKDFMPAMGRCRQKGRRIGLVSMRSACNRALYETPNLKDFDVVWLEDHLDGFIQPKRENERRRGNANVSEYALIKIGRDFIASSGLTRVSSRDIGKYLKTINIGERCILDEVKETYGGLYQFLVVSEVFVVEKKVTEKAFWVASRENMDMKLEKLISTTRFTDDEKSFFDDYDTSLLVDERDKFYHHSIEDDDWPSNEQFFSITPNNSPPGGGGGGPSNIGHTLTSSPDYTSLTVVKLKEICRERKLPVSGKKADLIQRITEDDDRLREQSSVQTIAKTSPGSYLEGLISEYLQVKGGEASSRDVGRYLQANKASEYRSVNDRVHASALKELKELHGSIRKYIVNSDLFECVEIDQEDRDLYEFLVRFAKQ